MSWKKILLLLFIISAVKTYPLSDVNLDTYDQAQITSLGEGEIGPLENEATVTVRENSDDVQVVEGAVETNNDIEKKGLLQRSILKEENFNHNADNKNNVGKKGEDDEEGEPNSTETSTEPSSTEPSSTEPSSTEPSSTETSSTELSTLPTTILPPTTTEKVTPASASMSFWVILLIIVMVVGVSYLIFVLIKRFIELRNSGVGFNGFR